MIPIKDNIPTDRFGFVTLGLIITNVVVYILAIRHGSGSFISGPDAYETFHLSAIPYAILHPGVHCAEVVNTNFPIPAPRAVCNTQLLNLNHIPAENLLPSWETIFTGMFMHASIIHIGGNMIFLWIFGNNIEDAMGRAKFLLFYLLGGVVAALAQVAVDPSSTVPTLGASGAIAAVLGGYALLYPRARVLTVIFIIFFFTVVELPALLVLAIWFGLQLLDSSAVSATGTAGGVAYFAHIGGFIFGLLFVRLFASRYNRDYDRPSPTVPRPGAPVR